MAPWEASRGAAAGRRPAWLAERALQLLTLAAQAVRVEPGLLRALRRLLPEARNDAGAEADVWGHPYVSSGSSVALTVSSKALNKLRDAFAALDPALREQALLTLRRWREALPREIWYEEVLCLEPHDQHLFAGEIALAQEEFLRIAATIQKHGDAVIGSEIEQGIIAWFLRFHPRTADREGLWRASPELGQALHQAEAIVFRDQSVAPTAIGFDPRFIGAPGRERIWTVRQIGDALHIAEETASATSPPGSPLALLPSTRDIVQHVAGTPEVSVVDQGFKAVLYLEPATGRLIEGRLVKPAWANAFGQDQYGIWAAFRFGEVEQRLRHIPPGRFLMGSPKTEVGRYDDEKPHQVTLTEGFWLFDTPVTQALWTAVMEKNPSRFQSPERPVENVSWEECQAFIEKINQQISGLALRLPTEAEWEYACRAGTTTATYVGDLEIKDDKAKILDKIAWYWGNSKSETHPVALKTSNAWGLYDMLGNVYEWCSDWYGTYSGKDEINPTGPERVGASR
ncbi:formylglycine-generating enzyme family protein, partial [candidate division KSB1 bacterium]|nr:formylglycine-generating enzyme family protein [candidate division KSB1 bacterium]